MALSFKAGSFTVNTSAGNQAVTGVGFQPKALMLWLSPLTADGSGVNCLVAIGAADGTSDMSCYLSAEDAQATTDIESQQVSTRVMVSRDPNNNVIAFGEFVSFDADGFTINFDFVGGAAYKCQYIALAGDDLTNVKLLGWNTPTSTGNASVTGAGFQPDCVIFFGQSALGSSGFVPMLGFTDGTRQAAICASTILASATSRAKRIQRTDRCFISLNGGSVFEDASVVSLDSDGFTLNWHTINATPRANFALCLKGGSYYVGSDTQKTSTGTKATTGVGFQPVGLLLASFCNVAATTVQANWRTSFGAASGPTSRWSVWSGETDGQADSICDNDLDTAAALKMLTEGTPTTDSEADLDSFDSDGFTLDWVTADATAREFVYLAFGSEGGGGSAVSPDPATLTITGVAPGTKKTATVAPAQVQLAGVSPATAKRAGLSPATIDLVALAPTVHKRATVSPATIAVSAVSPAVAKRASVDPAALTFTPVSPATRKGASLAAAVLTLTGVVPDTSLDVDLPPCESRRLPRRGITARLPFRPITARLPRRGITAQLEDR